MIKIGYRHTRFLSEFDDDLTTIRRNFDDRMTGDVTIILSFEIVQGLKIYQYLVGSIVAKAVLLP